MIYIEVLCNSTESLHNRSTILHLFIGPYAAATVRRFSMKVLARYQVILLGEQRLQKLQVIQNAAARLVTGARKCERNYNSCLT